MKTQIIHEPTIIGELGIGYLDGKPAVFEDLSPNQDQDNPTRFSRRYWYFVPHDATVRAGDYLWWIVNGEWECGHKSNYDYGILPAANYEPEPFTEDYWEYPISNQEIREKIAEIINEYEDVGELPQQVLTMTTEQLRTLRKEIEEWEDNAELVDLLDYLLTIES